MRALGLEGGSRSVSRVDDGFVPVDEQTPSEALHDRVETRVREASGARPARKQGVPREEMALEQERDRTRRVAGCVNDGQGMLPDSDLFSVPEWFVRFQSGDCRIGRMKPERDAQHASHGFDCSDVIVMSVGCENRADFAALGGGQNPIGFRSCIHNDRASRARDDVGVVVERPNDQADDSQIPSIEQNLHAIHCIGRSPLRL